MFLKLLLLGFCGVTFAIPLPSPGHLSGRHEVYGPPKTEELLRPDDVHSTRGNEGIEDGDLLIFVKGYPPGVTAEDCPNYPFCKENQLEPETTTSNSNFIAESQNGTNKHLDKEQHHQINTVLYPPGLNEEICPNYPFCDHNYDKYLFVERKPVLGSNDGTVNLPTTLHGETHGQQIVDQVHQISVEKPVRVEHHLSVQQPATHHHSSLTHTSSVDANKEIPNGPKPNHEPESQVNSEDDQGAIIFVKGYPPGITAEECPNYPFCDNNIPTEGAPEATTQKTGAGGIELVHHKVISKLFPSGVNVNGLVNNGKKAPQTVGYTHFVGVLNNPSSYGVPDTVEISSPGNNQKQDIVSTQNNHPTGQLHVSQHISQETQTTHQKITNGATQHTLESAIATKKVSTQHYTQPHISGSGQESFVFVKGYQPGIKANYPLKTVAQTITHHVTPADGSPLITTQEHHVISGEVYPPGLTKHLCPNYPFCTQNPLVLEHTGTFQSSVGQKVHNSNLPGHSTSPASSKDNAPTSQPSDLEDSQGAVVFVEGYPAEVKEEDCPNFPFCDRHYTAQSKPNLKVSQQSAQPVEAFVYPPGLSEKLCPNYPYCSHNYQGYPSGIPAQIPKTEHVSQVSFHPGKPFSPNHQPHEAEHITGQHASSHPSNYPDGVDPQSCPNYPFCDSIQNVHTPPQETTIIITKTNPDVPNYQTDVVYGIDEGVVIMGEPASSAAPETPNSSEFNSYQPPTTVQVPATSTTLSPPTQSSTSGTTLSSTTLTPPHGSGYLYPVPTIKFEH